MIHEILVIILGKYSRIYHMPRNWGQGSVAPLSTTVRPSMFLAPEKQTFSFYF